MECIYLNICCLYVANYQICNAYTNILYINVSINIGISAEYFKIKAR